MIVEFYQTLMARRSVRAFEDRAPPRETIGRLFEAAREAPSAHNYMPWKLVVVTDREAIAAVAASGPYGRFMAKAPLVIVGCGDGRISPQWCGVDTAIALEHVCLAAAAEGLGSCWVGSFDEALVRRLVGAPEGFCIVALLAIGYPKDRIDLTKLAAHLIHPAKPLSSLASEGRFDLPWNG